MRTKFLFFLGREPKKGVEKPKLLSYGKSFPHFRKSHWQLMATPVIKLYIKG